MYTYKIIIPLKFYPNYTLSTFTCREYYTRFYEKYCETGVEAIHTIRGLLISPERIILVQKFIDTYYLNNLAPGTYFTVTEKGFKENLYLSRPFLSSLLFLFNRVNNILNYGELTPNLVYWYVYNKARAECFRYYPYTRALTALSYLVFWRRPRFNFSPEGTGCNGPVIFLNAKRLTGDFLFQGFSIYRNYVFIDKNKIPYLVENVIDGKVFLLKNFVKEEIELTSAETRNLLAHSLYKGLL